MSGETDLTVLLRSMEPHLWEGPFIFCSIDPATYERLEISPIGMFREREGVTLILEREQADEANLSYTELWACITLNIHSALTAVGFIAAISSKLAAAGLSVNPVSAYYHDHLFVLWAERERALKLLREFNR
ncbi:MAG TPA: ACT domain-containing protein [Anaerolineales bacterium]|nr:ACT domain-containing protein [Anaerolineales bacterium]